MTIRGKTQGEIIYRFRVGLTSGEPEALRLTWYQHATWAEVFPERAREEGADFELEWRVDLLAHPNTGGKAVRLDNAPVPTEWYYKDRWSGEPMRRGWVDTFPEALAAAIARADGNVTKAQTGLHHAIAMRQRIYDLPDLWRPPT